MTKTFRVRLGVASLAIGLAALLPSCSSSEDDPRGEADGTETTESAQVSWQRSDAFKKGGRRCATHMPVLTDSLKADVGDCSMTLTVIKPDYAPAKTYEITVVYHVIKKTDGTGQVDESFLRSQTDILNEDFGAIVGTPGAPGTNAKVQFVMATKDPKGSPTKGFEYVTNDAYFADPGPGAENAMKKALNWDPAHYLNVYINDAAGNLGYATFPQEDNGYKDGVVLLHSSIGRDSPEGGIYDQGRTATHEIGHYLGLFHTFQDGCGSPASPYSTGDLVADTSPGAQPTFDCPQGTQECGGPSAIRNYMNYTQDTCMNQFSTEQVNRLRCSMQNYRKTLYRVVDGGGENAPPVAKFAATASGLNATFKDASSDSDGTITGWSWSFGDGTSATVKDPSHAYAEAGTYAVTLTVTDNGGATATSTGNVTVVAGQTGGLENGVAATGLSGALTSERRFTFVVPTGAKNLKFATTGGTGDADMYVRLNTAPTMSAWDYRPYKNGNIETISVATPKQGTYHVMLRGYAAFSGVSLTASYTP